jgi:hypothetical protein
MGTLAQEESASTSAMPPVRPVAGIGEICRHERLSDGRFLIWLFGLSRVRIREVPSDRLYRRVAFEPFLEIAPPADREPLLRDRLRKAILARCDGTARIPDEIPISCLADLLLQRLGLSQAEMETLFEEMDVETRAECGLELHEKRAAPRRNRKPRRNRSETRRHTHEPRRLAARPLHTPPPAGSARSACAVLASNPGQLTRLRAAHPDDHFPVQTASRDLPAKPGGGSGCGRSVST